MYSNQFMPHGHCYLWKPFLIGIHSLSDLLIGLAYIGISLTLYILVKRVKLHFSRVVLFFGLFIGACGLTHFLDVWNLWHSEYWLSGFIKIVTAVASIFTGIYLYQLRHQIVSFFEAVKISESLLLTLESYNLELEKKINERTEALREAVRARDEFLSLASHELKTPLTTLKLKSQYRLKKLEQNPELIMSNESSKEFYQFVEQQTNRLNKVVEDMLDVSRIQSGQMQLKNVRTDLCLITGEIIERFMPELHRAGNFVTKDFKCNPTLSIDVFRIEQVLGNLISNAIKYAPRTEIIISIEEYQEGQIKICLKDHGPGILPENIEKVFQRFERVNGINGPSGLGLGLYLSRQIIEAHGGKIWAESKFGEETSFIILLPA